MRGRVSPHCAHIGRRPVDHEALPGADALGHSDDVTQAGWRLHLCPRAHCHGDQFFSQSVADLHVGMLCVRQGKGKRTDGGRKELVTFRMEMQ